MIVQAGRQWLKPVILATEEAKIRKFAVQNHPGQIVLKTLSRKTPSPKNVWMEWLKV
jgi:hypothetical protein